MTIFMLLLSSVYAQSVKIQGMVTDAGSGEALPGVYVSVPEINGGTVTDADGIFLVVVESGDYMIRFDYVGYRSVIEQISADQDILLDIRMEIFLEETEAIISTASSSRDVIGSVEMSVTQLDYGTIGRIPAVLGEVDLIKGIQLLPGVSSVAEGVSGFNVRGGAVDQNLVLLDNTPIFNASHLFGFFSVFNNDATGDAKLYKGGIPAKYGGRLSSVLEVNQRDGNREDLLVAGGIGLVSSRLLVEGPLPGKKGSFLVAGRRSYGDLFLPLFDIDNRAYFYDLNMRAYYELNPKNKLYISGYLGHDILEIADVFGNNWGNKTFSLRWNHQYSQQTVWNITAGIGVYDYGLDILGEGSEFEWRAAIQTMQLSADFYTGFAEKSVLDYGLSVIYYRFDPGVINPLEQTSSILPGSLDKKYALEPAAYIGYEYDVSSAVKVQLGLRYSAFVRMGEQTVYKYMDNRPVQYIAALGRYEDGVVVDSVRYGPMEPVSVDQSLEPRISARYRISEHTALKLSYNRTTQYVHLISNSTAPNPLDLWSPSGPYTEPQRADQIALGVFQDLDNGGYGTSVELYYKRMHNQLDYVDGASLTFNNTIETELLTGEGRAYGVEFLFEKRRGKLTGWFSYTFAKSERRVPGLGLGDPGINGGNFYPSNYDKLHDISLSGSYSLNKNWTFSASFVYNTGRPLSYPQGRYEYAGIVVTQYEDRNMQRMPDYHRLDISATLHNKLGGDWIFSIYNVYNRMNATSITFRQNEENPVNTEAIRTTIFGFVPSITYNFAF